MCCKLKLNKVPILWTFGFGFVVVWCLKEHLSAQEEIFVLISLDWVSAMVRESVENIKVVEKRLVRSQESFIDCD